MADHDLSELLNSAPSVETTNLVDLTEDTPPETIINSNSYLLELIANLVDVTEDTRPEMSNNFNGSAVETITNLTDVTEDSHSETLVNSNTPLEESSATLVDFSEPADPINSSDSAVANNATLVDFTEDPHPANSINSSGSAVSNNATLVDFTDDTHPANSINSSGSAVANNATLVDFTKNIHPNDPINSSCSTIELSSNLVNVTKSAPPETSIKSSGYQVELTNYLVDLNEGFRLEKSQRDPGGDLSTDLIDGADNTHSHTTSILTSRVPLSGSSNERDDISTGLGSTLSLGLVAIKVGRGPSRFFVNQKLLCDVVPSFTKVLNLQDTMPQIVLGAQDDLAVFELFTQWLYSKPLAPIANHPDWNSMPFKYMHSSGFIAAEKPYHDLYYAAEKWGLPALKNRVMDCLRSFHRDNAATIHPEFVARGYANTSKGSPLRLYLANAAAYAIMLEERKAYYWALSMANEGRSEDVWEDIQELMREIPNWIAAGEPDYDSDVDFYEVEADNLEENA